MLYLIDFRVLQDIPFPSVCVICLDEFIKDLNDE